MLLSSSKFRQEREKRPPVSSCDFGELGLHYRNVLQLPFQPRDLAQLNGHVHRGQHRDAADERPKRRVAAVEMEHEQAADHVEEADGEQGRGDRVRERRSSVGNQFGRIVRIRLASAVRACAVWPAPPCGRPLFRPTGWDVRFSSRLMYTNTQVAKTTSITAARIVRSPQGPRFTVPLLAPRRTSHHA